MPSHEEQKKRARMHAEHHHKHGAEYEPMKSFRTKEARDEDRAYLAKEKQYEEEEAARKMYGSKPSHVYAGDKYHKELKEEIERRHKYETEYGD